MTQHKTNGLDLQALNELDPLKRNVEKELGQEELTPMEPPSAYELPVSDNLNFKEFAMALQILMNEHQMALEKITRFEQALVQFKKNGYKLETFINDTFKEFFNFFDDKLLPHNQKEEKALFPFLHQRLIEAGEHSIGANPKTAIDVMEDDHIKFIQLGALTFNLLGVATRLNDIDSRNFVFDTAYENGRELVEMLKLHIYREDYTLFPLANKHLTSAELDNIEKSMCKMA